MIEVKNLTKRFGEFAAVDDLSFGVRGGETFALLGPNGSGKTTLVKCLTGLAAPSSGEVFVGGFSLAERAREARRLMSYLPQRVAFHESLTAREVLEFYCRLRRLPARRVGELLETAGFQLDGFADRPVGEFSGGMVQRLGLAVACLPDAPVLVLDEPTVSLDPEGAIRFRDFLSALKRQGKTILFSSHVLADVELLADRVAILVGGRLAALHTVEALRDELMRGSRLRVVLQNPEARWAEAALRAGADGAALEGDSLLLTSSAEGRLEILKSIEAEGARVVRFGTEESSLEDIYMSHIRGEGSGHERRA
jgi:Cu-processing system ATP-binding protein